VQRSTPTLGPVTQAITAQDRAPPFIARHRPDAAMIPVPAAGRSSSPLRSNLWLLFLLLGAVLVGALAYGVRQQWLAQQLAGSATVPGPGAAPGEMPATTREARARSEVPAEAETHAALIVGRWQCVEAASGRVVENEFGADGRYRSLAHGRPDAFQQIDQLDVLVEGRYRLDGDTVVLHVQNIPSREFFGGPARADDYLFWRIDSLTRDAMVWSDSQLQEVRESCLRSQSLLPVSGRQVLDKS
jgi:hypothetical protein